MKYLKGAGRPERQHRRATRRDEEGIKTKCDQSSIFDAQCALELEFEARCDDRCALLLEFEVKAPLHRCAWFVGHCH